MATIRKLPSGRWNAQIRRKGHCTVSNTFLNRSDAERWIRITESEIERGNFIDRSEAEATSLKEALERYRLEITPGKKGYVQETRRIAVWQRHVLSRRSLASLKGSDFASYRNERLQRAAPATVRLELAIISHLYTVAAQDWGIEGLSNPIKSIRKPRVNNARSRRLSQLELDRLVEASQASKNRELPYLVQLAIETGMRLGEMISLKWGQVDWLEGCIVLYETKNGDSRLVPLTPKARVILDELRQKGQESRIFTSWADSGAIKKSWHTALKRAEITDFRFHDLRHEATSRLFEKGLNMVEVATITGHKTLQMLKRYTHPRAEELVRKLNG